MNIRSKLTFRIESNHFFVSFAERGWLDRVQFADPETFPSSPKE